MIVAAAARARARCLLPAAARRIAPARAAHAPAAPAALWRAPAQRSLLAAAAPAAAAVAVAAVAARAANAEAAAAAPALEAEPALEPVTKTPVPRAIAVAGGHRAELVGLGVRQVTLLRVSVYTAALYVDDQVRRRLRASSRWAQEFAADKLVAGQADARWFAHDLAAADASGVVALRIEPVRNTDGPHLRNGFERFLNARLREEIQRGAFGDADQAAFARALDEFRALFPAGVIRKGTPLVFARLPGGRLHVEIEGRPVGVVDSPVLAEWVIEGYLRTPPISPPLVASAADGLQAIARP
ncbi:hypothetical protein HK105_200493 [Polyrhizophydium stewartii]|uniref:Chalcone isomerase domain-containing protein n=1 Tax=Polyrhizophydium stewartii TaxID=2732419 RepID=A0ABR4NJ69_9FUNG